jgi:rhodanese-related sulfurtransferase
MSHSEGFLKLVADARTRVRCMTLDEYLAMRNSAEPHVLVDVREDGEWAAGHAEGAVHMGKGIIERDIEGAYPDKKTPLVLYCGGGYRSALAADALMKMGYPNAISLEGGWRAWTAAGLPVKR